MEEDATELAEVKCPSLLKSLDECLGTRFLKNLRTIFCILYYVGLAVNTDFLRFHCDSQVPSIQLQVSSVYD